MTREETGWDKANDTYPSAVHQLERQCHVRVRLTHARWVLRRRPKSRATITPISHSYLFMLSITFGTHHKLDDVYTEMFIHHRVHSDASLTEELQNARIWCIHHKIYVFLRRLHEKHRKLRNGIGMNGYIPRPVMSPRALSALRRAQNLPRFALLRRAPGA